MGYWRYASVYSNYGNENPLFSVGSRVRGFDEATSAGISRVGLNAVVNDVAAKLVGTQGRASFIGETIVISDAQLDLPAAILDMAIAQDVPFDEVKGAFYDCHIYHVRENLKHERDAEETFDYEQPGRDATYF